MVSREFLCAVLDLRGRGAHYATPLMRANNFEKQTTNTLGDTAGPAWWAVLNQSRSTSFPESTWNQGRIRNKRITF